MKGNEEFSLGDLRLLAAAERQMDANEVPWVRVEGVNGRCMVRPEVMQLLELRSGQTVSSTLLGEIIKLNLKVIEDQLAGDVQACTAQLERQMSGGQNETE